MIKKKRFFQIYKYSWEFNLFKLAILVFMTRVYTVIPIRLFEMKKKKRKEKDWWNEEELIKFISKCSNCQNGDSLAQKST